jgi:methylated-DNA-[protein]-cysteine S-methyltransferase
MEFVSRFETELGAGVVISSEKGIRRVVLPSNDGMRPQGEIVPSGGVTSPLSERAARMLENYFKGISQNFVELPVDLGEFPPFRARILMLIRSIPHGEVKTYGEVAAMAAVPGAARAIGGAMASNPVPIIIPCHRVVGVNGKLTGFTAPGGLTVKKYLLRLEGVEFKGERVRRKIDGYKQEKLGMK